MDFEKKRKNVKNVTVVTSYTAGLYRLNVSGLKGPSISFVVLYAKTKAIYILMNNFYEMLYV